MNQKDLRSLVEADINTGQIRRTLYQIELDEWHPKIYWTPSMDTLYIDSNAVEDDVYSVRRGYFPNDIRGATLIQLPDGEPFTMPTELPELGKLSFCFHFSPSGRFLVARAFTHGELYEDIDLLPTLLVFDLQGNIQYTIEDSRLEVLGVDWADCPSWRPDEQAFYFLAGRYNESEENEAYILKYSLSDGSLTQYAQVLPRLYPAEENSWGGDLSSPLFVSPDGDHIAYELEGSYNLITDLAVAFPSGEVIRVGKSYNDNMYPIWIPPLQTNQQSN